MKSKMGIGRKKGIKKDVLRDTNAISTTIDTLFFLVFISIAAVILMPSVMQTDMSEAACYRSSEEMDIHLLESLLNGRVEEFEYSTNPLAMVEADIPENSITDDPLNVLFKKEQNHRTLADLIAEDLVLQMSIENNGTEVYLNPMAEHHAEMTSKAICSYIETMLAGSYNYQLETSWHPVEGYPLGSNIVIGEERPPDASRQGAKITIPLSYTTSKSDIFDTMNDTMVMEIMSEPSERSKHERIMEGFNSTIDTAAMDCSRQITATIFPATYLRSLISDGTVTGNTKNDHSREYDLMVASYMLEHTANDIIGMEMTIDANNISNDLISLIENKLMNSIQQSVASNLRAGMQTEISCTAS